MTDVVDTAGRIREEAVALFTAQGYANASLREIADRVGITKASLYYHYPSKQDLLIAVFDPLLAEWRAVVDAAEALPRDPESVRAILGATLDLMLRRREVAGLLARDAAGVLAALEPVVDDLMALGQRMERWLAGPAPTAVRRVRAAAALEVLGTALRSGTTLTDVPPAQVRATLLEAATMVLGQVSTRLVLTDRRTLVLVDGSWVSYDHSGVAGFRPDPAAFTLDLSFHGAALPMRLLSPEVPVLSVVLAGILLEVDGMRRVPAFARFGAQADAG